MRGAQTGASWRPSRTLGVLRARVPSCLLGQSDRRVLETTAPPVPTPSEVSVTGTCPGGPPFWGLIFLPNSCAQKNVSDVFHPDGG